MKNTGAPARSASPGRPGEIRIIGGQWRRSRIPVADRPGLRPTPDRVRETLFNWLGQDLSGWRVVDAFAGTGALGFEAASRGAARVLMIETDAALVRALQGVRERLGAEAMKTVQIERGDALAALARLAAEPGMPAGAADLVLLDPPFAAGLFDAALAAAARCVVPGGWVYLEADQALDAERAQALGLVPHRQLKAGQVHATLLQRPASGATDAAGAAPPHGV